MTDVVKVPKNRMIDMRKTSGTGAGKSHSVPTSVPLYI